MTDEADIDVPALLAALDPFIDKQAQQKSIPRAVLLAHLNDLAARGALMRHQPAIAEQIEYFARRFDRAYKRLIMTADIDAGLASIRTQAADLMLRSEYDEPLRMIRAERLRRADGTPFERRVLWADEASLDFLQGRYLEAAEKCAEAAQLAQGDVDRLAMHLWDQADALRHEAVYSDSNACLSEAVALYRRVKELRPREANVRAFVEICADLGSALQVHGDNTETLQPFQDAAEVLREGLSALGPNTDRNLFAWMQNQLGHALLTLGRNGSEGALDEAIGAFGLASEAYDRETSPHDWAHAHLALGQAIRERGGDDNDPSWRERALVACSAALDTIAKESGDLDWARLKIDCGELLVEISFARPGAAELRGAIAAYRDALTVFTRERDPHQWMILQVRIGDALRSLARRDDAAESMRGAVAAYRLALQEISRDDAPALWSDLQERIGMTCVMLRDHGERRLWLGQAIDAFRAAADAISRREAPLVWARIHNNLGSALSMRGGAEGDASQLEEAIRALRNALLERHAEEVPQDWAATQCNMGNVLLQLGQRNDDSERLLEALTVFRDALAVQLQHCSGYDCALTHKDIGDALTALAERESDQAMLREAVESYREALVIIDDNDPELETIVRERMGRTEALLAAPRRLH